MTAAELKELDAGGWFDKVYGGLKFQPFASCASCCKSIPTFGA